MKWLGQCLAARSVNFIILFELPKKSCSFELRHFINPECYQQPMAAVLTTTFGILMSFTFVRTPTFISLIIISLVCAFATLPSKLDGQSINHTWASEESISCIAFDSVTHTVDIGDFNSHKEGKQRIEYKVKGDRLKIMWYFNQTIFGYEKDTYWLSIDLLTEEKLILTFLPKKRNDLLEIFGGATVIFKRSNVNCHEYFKVKTAK